MNKISKYRESLKLIKTKFVGRISLIERLSLTALEEAIDKAEKYDEATKGGKRFVDQIIDLKKENQELKDVVKEILCVCKIEHIFTSLEYTMEELKSKDKIKAILEVIGNE